MSEQRNWLQRLKEESWEAELLVSAVAIFGIFQSFALVDYFINFLINKLYPSQYFVGYFVAFLGLLAISILAAMFIIHFILRSYWIGLVGLNSVFPDYSLKDSAYSQVYTKKMMDYLPKLSTTIDTTDELCSVIFSAAFSILGVYMYLATISTLYLLLFNALKAYVPEYILLIPALIFLAGLVFQSVLSIVANLKRFKSNVRLQQLSFQVVKITSLLSFGPFSKNFLQVSMIFGSNFKKKKGLVLLVLLFLGVGAILSKFQIERTNLLFMVDTATSQDPTKVHPHFYATNNESLSLLLHPEIDADVIEKKVIKLFVPILDNELDHFKSACGIQNNKTKLTASAEEIAEIQRQFLSCYQSNHFVEVDGKRFSVEFMKYDHPITDQFGILGYVDLTGIERGQHRLKVIKNGPEKESRKWTIPFYQVKNF